MPTAVPLEERAVLDRLLSGLARRVDGAIDFWTLVPHMPEEMGPIRRGFLASRGDDLRSLASAVGVVLAEFGHLETPPVRESVARMETACANLQGAFSVLENYRMARLDDIRTATESLCRSRTQLLDALRNLGTLLGLPVNYFKEQTPESEEHIQAILRGLFEQFRQGHSGA